MPWGGGGELAHDGVNLILNSVDQMFFGGDKKSGGGELS